MAAQDPTQNAMNEIFYLNKPMSEIAAQLGKTNTQVMTLMNKYQLEWDHEAGKWKDLRTGRLSPGPAR